MRQAPHLYHSLHHSRYVSKFLFPCAPLHHPARLAPLGPSQIGQISLDLLAGVGRCFTALARHIVPAGPHVSSPIEPPCSIEIKINEMNQLLTDWAYNSHWLLLL
jgi:hypothetical protein